MPSFPCWRACHPPHPSLSLSLQHEKIIRGLAMGLALISYGIEEAADTLIEQMAREQDPILRYGAMYVLGMAYRCALRSGLIAEVPSCVRRPCVRAGHDWPATARG